MKRILGHGLKFVAVATLALVLTPACADNNMSIFIRHAMAPPQSRTNGRCLYLADATLPFISEGVVDIRARDTYEATLLVGNQLVAQSDPESLRSESNRAVLNGAVVKVTDPNGGFLGEFTAPASAFIEPSGTTLPSFSPLGVTVIDAPTMRRISANLPFGETRLVLTIVKAFGQTIGGVDLESGEFQFPVRVCNGCLVSFAQGDDPLTPEIDCTLKLDTTDQSEQPCSPGQDEGTPCQLCLDHAGCQSR